MTEVFIVSVGEYDDNHNVGVWSTREQATAHIDRLMAAEPKSYSETYPAALEVCTLDIEGAPTSFEWFEPEEHIRDREEARAQRIYDSKRQRYGSPADGPEWIDKMANRFRFRLMAAEPKSYSETYPAALEMRAASQQGVIDGQQPS